MLAGRLRARWLRLEAAKLGCGLPVGQSASATVGEVVGNTVERKFSTAASSSGEEKTRAVPVEGSCGSGPTPTAV